MPRAPPYAHAAYSPPPLELVVPLRLSGGRNQLQGTKGDFGIFVPQIIHSRQPFDVYLTSDANLWEESCLALS